MERSPLHIVVVNYVYDDGLASPEEFLAHAFTLTGWAAGLREAGARVTVVARCGRGGVVDDQGTRYQFVSDECAPWPRAWQVPRRVHQAVRAACAEAAARGRAVVVHVNGLVFPLATHALALAVTAAAGRDQGAAVVAQHHAERPWSGVARFLQRWGLKSVDGFLFTNRELARTWVEGGTIRTWAGVHEVMEASSAFRYEDRAAARARTGLRGEPVLLWTGNLDPNKDPLTVLEGFERVLDDLPAARLYMAYRRDDLLPEVRERLAESERLRAAVTLLGEIPHGEIENYYNSADLFVQGSAREGSGLALLDAMACGVVPIVTDIPSFRTITDDGRVGQLWERGDVESFVRALLEVSGRGVAPLSQRTRRYFERMWSPGAVGCQAVAAYRRILAKRHGGCS